MLTMINIIAKQLHLPLLTFLKAFQNVDPSTKFTIYGFKSCIRQKAGILIAKICQQI